ncbi:hypothetical protein HK100_004644 [Physocladia obscura]|uniref:Glycosyltransferase family 31 protein n=1 Tax=Physocladia obscura TaxID=109957 RepID=A0AAD5SSH5_9FUNG|nr:hypothetical protein HK100_004644 [Physocladia obscura]
MMSWKLPIVKAIASLTVLILLHVAFLTKIPEKLSNILITKTTTATAANTLSFSGIPKITFKVSPTTSLFSSSSATVFRTQHFPPSSVGNPKNVEWPLNAVLPPSYTLTHEISRVVTVSKTGKRRKPLSDAKIEEFLFGIATTPERIEPNIEIWASWLQVAEGRRISPALVVSLDQAVQFDEIQQKSKETVIASAQRLNLDIRFHPTEISRYEQRVLFLVRELWNAASSKTKWFVIQDDDTVWMTQRALVETASWYPDPLKNSIVIGAESESNTWRFGHIAYGGGGIIMSRHLVERMNRDGVLEECYTTFEEIFGGDGILSHCIAAVTKKALEEIIMYNDALHQMDFGGTAAFFFEAAPLVTSMHHWNTWFTLFPQTTLSAPNNFASALLLTRVARLIGYENLSRRFVMEGGAFVVHVGYSVVFYKSHITNIELVPDTEWKYYNSKAYALVEGQDKVSYFIADVKVAEDGSGDVVMQYRNSNGDELDVVWSAPKTM